jgi:hypothetical protein
MTNGNFTKTKKASGVGVGQHQTEILLEHPLKDTKINPSALPMHSATVTRVLDSELIQERQQL